MKKQKNQPKGQSGKGRPGLSTEVEEIITAGRQEGYRQLDKKSLDVETGEKRAEEDVEGEWDGEEKRWPEENPQDDEPGEVP